MRREAWGGGAPSGDFARACAAAAGGAAGEAPMHTWNMSAERVDAQRAKGRGGESSGNYFFLQRWLLWEIVET